MFLFLALLIAATPPQAGDGGLDGRETTIPDAANGGIINWVPSKKDHLVVYLQSRRLQWYQVKMTGPCAWDNSRNALIFDTHNDTRFDRFSTIHSVDEPNKVCGVSSIVRVATPSAYKASHTDLD